MIRMIVNMGSSSEAMLKYLLGIWLIWGMNWVVMKSANEYFDPAVFVAWRFGTGALILLGVCLYKRLSLPEKNYWPWIIGSGILSGCLNPVLIQLGMVELGAGMFIYLAILSRPDTVWCTASVMVVVYNGLIASAIAFLMWTYVLQNMEAGKASIAILVVPVVGVIGGIVFLGETVTLKTAIGMLLVAAGVAGTVKS